MNRKSIISKITNHINITFLILLLITLIYNYFNGINDKYFRIILTGAVIIIVDVIYKKFLTEKYKTNYNIILLFIFAAMYVGNILNVYRFIYFYDKILHFISGIVIGHVVFNIIQNSVNITESKLFMCIFIISFGIGCAGLWEIYEFTTDTLFGFNSQNSSLNDTMYDIICGTLGSILWLICYLYLKRVKQKIK